MAQIISVLSPVPRFLASLRFPNYIDRNWDHMFGERLKVEDLSTTHTNISENSKNARAYILHTFALLSLYAPAGRWLSYGSALTNLVDHGISWIRESTHDQSKSTDSSQKSDHKSVYFNHKWGVVKSLIELVSTCYRLKVGLALHAAMDSAESCYHYAQNGDWQELLPAVSSGLYLTTFLPIIPKKVRDTLVCLSLAYSAGLNFYRSYLHYKAIDVANNPNGRDYYGLVSRALLGSIRLYQAGKLGYQLTQNDTAVQRTIVIMRPASQKDKNTSGLTDEGKARTKSIAAVMDKVVAEHGGKPAIFVSPQEDSRETGDLVGGSLKRPVGVTVCNDLTESSKVRIFGERSDEQAHRLDGAVQEILNKTDAGTIPFVITHGDIAKKYVDELRDIGGDVSEVFKRRLHTGEMIVLRRTGDEVVLVERIRPPKA